MQVQFFLAVVGLIFAIVAFISFENEELVHAWWSVLVTALCWGTSASIESKWTRDPDSERKA